MESEEGGGDAGQAEGEGSHHELCITSAEAAGDVILQSMALASEGDDANQREGAQIVERCYPDAELCLKPKLDELPSASSSSSTTTPASSTSGLMQYGEIGERRRIKLAEIDEGYKKTTLHHDIEEFKVSLGPIMH